MRTVEQLLSTRPHSREGETVVLVSAEEGRVLAEAGAEVSSGYQSCADGESTVGTQRYHINDMVFLWLEGLFTRTASESYPVRG